MSEQERKAFEKRFPVPGGIFWNEVSEQYDAAPGSGRDELVEIYHGQWVAWQAARAQAPASGEVEPVDEKGSLSWFVEVYNHGYQAGHNDTVEGGFTDVHYSDLQTYHEDVVIELLEGLNVSTSQTHPPAKVPEGFEDTFRSVLSRWQVFAVGDPELIDKSDMALFRKAEDMLNNLTTPTPATTPEAVGDGWIRCDERLPSEADEDFEGRVWLCWPCRDLVERVTRRTTSFCDGFWWKPTGLRKPTPPTAQEGSDNE